MLTYMQGINGIAGTLYSIISAPGLENPILANIICSGFIVYFLAFLYFEGPSSGHMDPNDTTRRKIYWLLLHLPFLLCIMLLLQGEFYKYIQVICTQSVSRSQKSVHAYRELCQYTIPLVVWTNIH